MPNDVVEILVQRLDTGEMLRVKGREAWTLNCLLETGQGGVIPLERPAPRWSAYVHSLRKRGLVIDTIGEEHAGPYSGTHGRYVLRTPLKVLKMVFAEDKRSRGFSDVVKAAYAQIIGHTPDPAS